MQRNSVANNTIKYFVFLDKCPLNMKRDKETVLRFLKKEAEIMGEKFMSRYTMSSNEESFIDIKTFMQ